MDANALIVLRTDMDAQMALIREVYAALVDRAQDLDAGDLRQLESVAYQIHNLYNAVKDLLKLVAAHFENHITDAQRWYSLLLRRMARPIPGVRPALLSQETVTVLDALRGFRHFFSPRVRSLYRLPAAGHQLQCGAASECLAARGH